MSKSEVDRLLCAIYPTRLERVLSAVAERCWRRSDAGAVGWVGDVADSVRVRSIRRRAPRERHRSDDRLRTIRAWVNGEDVSGPELVEELRYWLDYWGGDR